MIKPLKLQLTNPIEEEGDDGLFKSLRGLLIFGRIIGLLPYKGIFSSSSANLKCSWTSFPAIITCLILSVLTFNSFLEFLLSTSASKKNAYEIAQSVRSTLYLLWGTFIYFNFVLRSTKFLNIFHSWRTTFLHFTKPDTKLKRDVIAIAAVVLVSATLENATLYVQLLQDIIEAATHKSNSSVTTVLQLHYSSGNRSWAKYFSYHPAIVVLIFVQHKFILFSWNCMDIWITVLGRALYFKFKALCEVAQDRLVEPFKRNVGTCDKLAIVLPGTKQDADPQEWKKIAHDHTELIELLQTFEKFLSPLIFISYSVNIYYICMQLLDGLTLGYRKNTTIFDTINRPWSFAHLLLRAYLLTICCARVNVYAHQISTVINECPEECYTTNISRLDKRVVGGPDIGLTGLGCFTVTKPFILAVLGVVFTVEIVLLQVVPNEGAESQEKTCCCPK